MKKVILLGDSIRMMGYGPRIPALLGEAYSVWQPEDNCRFASYTLRMAFEYADALKQADIIHFNCGLWDECDLFGDGPFTPLPVYADTMVRLARILKSYLAPGGKLIFATSTVPSPRMWGHDAKRIQDYNQAVLQAFQTPGSGLEDVQIDDLYTPVCQNVDALICEDLIHLNEQGSILCASLVADSIRRAAES